MAGKEINSTKNIKDLFAYCCYNATEAIIRGAIDTDLFNTEFTNSQNKYVINMEQRLRNEQIKAANKTKPNLVAAQSKKLAQIAAKLKEANLDMTDANVELILNNEKNEKKTKSRSKTAAEKTGNGKTATKTKPEGLLEDYADLSNSAADYIYEIAGSMKTESLRKELTEEIGRIMARCDYFVKNDKQEMNKNIYDNIKIFIDDGKLDADVVATIVKFTIKFVSYLAYCHMVDNLYGDDGTIVKKLELGYILTTLMFADLGESSRLVRILSANRNKIRSEKRKRAEKMAAKKTATANSSEESSSQLDGDSINLN